MDKNIEKIFRLLDVDESNGLATVNNVDRMTEYQRQFFKQAREKLGIDAVYFLRDADGLARIPTIYFSMLDTYQPQKIAELHRLAWNMGEAPLLFVVVPDCLLIYDNYALPETEKSMQDAEAGLIETIKWVTDLETQRAAIQGYHRTLLESGEYWRRSRERFNSKTRVDSTLMFNLRFMRNHLVHEIQARVREENEINVAAIVHGLLSRSILIKYLEERKDSLNHSVFPDGFYNQFYEGASSYTDVLRDKEATYSLFKCLHKKFNGDMLPLIEDEYEIITGKDLALLREFLLGEFCFGDRQLALWRLYSFDVIPIQLISNIYELFFHLSEREDEKGTYYTPLHLVDMLLDEVYPWEGEFQDIKVLDPSCGSGIFLVEIYRRMVSRWMKSNHVVNVTNDQLRTLLEESIYGVDLNEEAVRVASFSLSLAMCDFLEPRNIWNQLRFPKLMGRNLTISDFFEDEHDFCTRKYDLIIGNPPWQSRLTESAERYLRKCGKVVGDKQIAQAFSIKCADLCKETGNICLLMPSKGLLFNRSLKSMKYRKDFFSENTVSVIINFSAYRKFLFAHGSGPAAGIIYKPVVPGQDSVILYCTPKPLYTMEDFRKFFIEPNDICRIPLKRAFDDAIWKIAMWGGPRDLELINKLQHSFRPLQYFIEKEGMISAEGYKRGNQSKQCADFLHYPIISAKDFKAFYQEEDELRKVDFTTFECVAAKKRDIFEPPHLVMKQSHRNARFLASVIDYKAVFNHSLMGIHGEDDKLKYLCLIINSKVFTYYHLMTNRRWMVERDELEAGDIWNTPIPEPSCQQLVQAAEIFDRLKKEGEGAGDFEAFVSSVYGLYDHERALIQDALDYGYDYYRMHGKSRAFHKPEKEDFVFYFETLTEILNNSFGSSAIRGSHFFFGDAPLAVLLLTMEGELNETPVFHTENHEVAVVLDSLDSKLKDENQNIYIKRNVRIYKGKSLYIIKMMQLKCWNYSAACRDADEIFGEIMKTWRCIDEQYSKYDSR